MPRAKSGTKRKGTVVPNKTNRAKTRKIQKADEAEPKEEELVRRVTHAVLEALEDRDKITKPQPQEGVLWTIMVSQILRLPLET